MTKALGDLRSRFFHDYLSDHEMEMALGVVPSRQPPSVLPPPLRLCCLPPARTTMWIPPDDPGELAGERVVHGRRGVSGDGRVLGTTGEMDTEEACLFRDRYAFRGGCTSMVAQYVGLASVFTASGLTYTRPSHSRPLFLIPDGRWSV